MGDTSDECVVSEEDEAEYNGDVIVDTKDEFNPIAIPSPLCDCLLVQNSVRFQHAATKYMRSRTFPQS